jgi:hypothetical protein
MTIEEIDESVAVRADFSGGEVNPRAFSRCGRVYRVDRVNARWLDRAGSASRHCFSLQVGDETYFLSLHTADMTWRLESVEL